jgi:hypothetical protein
MLGLRFAGALRAALTVPVAAARRVREQADREERARLIAQFAALEPTCRDPLERLWMLPARRPNTPL